MRTMRLTNVSVRAAARAERDRTEKPEGGAAPRIAATKTALSDVTDTAFWSPYN